ncbi:hypothetical protein [Corynebacterium pacaense]|uniref:hypothetical protein n=1 Tax=Corynebacterium pacaense TaxID=1816684 RepID=UPI001FE81E06|nr:hypothetical protein [Corynebacterium pacaense]
MASTLRAHIRLSIGVLTLVPLLASCSQEEEPAPEPTTSSETSTAPTSTTSTTPTTTSPTATPGASAGASTSTSGSGGMDRNVARVYETFKTLAPRSLFEQFDTCDPNGVENSSACTGPGVGQFQFFESQSKAASTTQLLTELRSSRVVEDTGKKIVGWTTMGTMSIITVVDNDNGLVLQQMVSSDKIDPEKRIYELGLAERRSTETTSETTAEQN